MSAQPPILPIFRAEDAAGASLPFALLYTYAAGTTTPLATYQDAAGTIPNANPVVCDANGLAVVYLADGVGYKLLLTDQDGAVQPRYPLDDIIGGAQGASGAPGSTWRDGSGVPSNSVGSDGDYYINTDNGDVYKRSTGAYAYVMNIRGPVGGSINAIRNGTFYRGMAQWDSLPSDPAAGVTPTAPSIRAGHTAESSSASLLAPQDVAVAVIYRGSVSQGFPIQVPAGTNALTFWTACYLESVAALNENSGYVKVYLYSATAATETLVGTYNLTATSPTASWTQQSIDLTSYLTDQGDYGLRFELQAKTDNIGGTAGSKGTVISVDDIQLLVSAAGVSGPPGATGPAGPAGPAGSESYLHRTTFAANGSITTGPSTTWLDVTCVAGGGAGAGYGASTAGGGGGGGSAVKARIPVMPSTVYNIVIGTGGIGGAVGAAGGDGTDTTFGGTLVVAKGGKGGAPTGQGGDGGIASTMPVCPGGAAGTDVAPAGVGTNASSRPGISVQMACPGAGGGGAGNYNAPALDNAGQEGGSTDFYAGGTAVGTAITNENGAGGGGASLYGSGGRGANNAATPVARNDAAPGTGYGSGGGGGCAFYGTGAGANGASGICIVDEIRS